MFKSLPLALLTLLFAAVVPSFACDYGRPVVAFKAPVYNTVVATPATVTYAVPVPTTVTFAFAPPVVVQAPPAVTYSATQTTTAIFAAPTVFADPGYSYGNVGFFGVNRGHYNGNVGFAFGVHNGKVFNAGNHHNHR